MFDVESLIRSGGVLVVAFIIFAESGLLVGFFLPGDTLLFSAGLLASQGLFPIIWLVLASVLAAIVGDNTGYSIGRRMGKRIFKKEDSLLFHKDHLLRAEQFYERHGGKTVTIARFVPMVRTFAPVVAGAGKMPRERFMFFNIIGGILWGAGLTLAGYFFGGRFPGLDKYIEYVLLGVVSVSIGASLLHLLREPKTRRILWDKVRLALRNISLNKKVD